MTAPAWLLALFGAWMIADLAALLREELRDREVDQ